MSALKWLFWDSHVLVRNLASAFGHPMQVSTQVQLESTCNYLPVRLTRSLNMNNKSSNLCVLVIEVAASIEIKYEFWFYWDKVTCNKYGGSRGEVNA